MDMCMDNNDISDHTDRLKHNIDKVTTENCGMNTILNYFPKIRFSSKDNYSKICFIYVSMN